MLYGSAFALSLIGIVLLYSAQHGQTEPTGTLWYSKQLIWLGVAVGVFFTAVFTPLRVHEIFAYVYLGVVWLVLASLLWLGLSNSEGRWISLGPAFLQPSELAKVALIFALARYLAYLKRSVLSLRALLTIAAIVVPTAVLVLRQPDLGTSLVFWAIAAGMIFWAGASPIKLLLLASPMLSLILAFNWVYWIVFFALLIVLLLWSKPRLLAAVGVVTANVAFGILTPLLWNRLLDYQKKRILIFLDPGIDPRGAGYQVIQSKVAIGSGGLWGKGFLEGTQTGLDFLPAKHTDFVFSICGEEFGLFGSAVVILLFCVLFWRMINSGYRARNSFARFLAIGAMSVLAFQMIVNIGMTLGIMPVTGLPLPFVSYGGTSLVVGWFLVGLAVQVRRRWQEY